MLSIQVVRTPFFALTNGYKCLFCVANAIESLSLNLYATCATIDIIYLKWYSVKKKMRRAVISSGWSTRKSVYSTLGSNYANNDQMNVFHKLPLLACLQLPAIQSIIINSNWINFHIATKIIIHYMRKLHCSSSIERAGCHKC